jgi:hypothetical protein
MVANWPQDPSGESATFRREASALVVGEPEAAPLYLFLENPVLLHQVLDDVLLVAVDPSREGHEQHLQGVDIGRHGPIVPWLTPARVPGGARSGIRTLRAWCILRRRKSPETAALRDWADRIAARRGRSIAVVALARRLAGILFAIWRDGTVYDATKVRGLLAACRAA